MSETDISKAIRDRLAYDPDVAIWRNNTGAIRKGSRFIHYGLCVGSSDTIGLVKGRFVALETKRPVKPAPTTKEQLEFMATVRARGGFACIVHSVEEAVAAVERAKGGASE